MFKHFVTLYFAMTETKGQTVCGLKSSFIYFEFWHFCDSIVMIVIQRSITLNYHDIRGMIIVPMQLTMPY